MIMQNLYLPIAGGVVLQILLDLARFNDYQVEFRGQFPKPKRNIVSEHLGGSMPP